ncbi:MAG: mechanosensitive ion channel family protein [Comamonadaceae bacterium]|nr:MAG: mechanosensitive ion channel family protein [Comamonadaceae bacterium]
MALAAALGAATSGAKAQAQPQTPARPASAASAPASKPDAEAPPQLPSVDDLRKQLDAVPQKLKEDDDGRKLLNDVYAIGSAAEQLATRRTEELVDLDSRLAGLGPTPEKGAAPDAPDVAEQRKALAKQRGVVDAEVKLARLITVDAEQRAAELIRQRREQFQAALTARIDSPLGGAFWRNLRNAVPGDVARLQSLQADLLQAVDRAMEPRHRATFIGSVIAALLMAVAGTWLAERLLVRLAPARLPAGRLRRSLFASVSVVVYVLLIGMAAQLAWSGLEVDGNFGEMLTALARSSVALAVFAAFVIGLGHALLARKRSSWRLPAISDDLATRLSPYPWWLAIIAAFGGLITEVNSIVGASLAAEVTAHAVTALLVSVVVTCILRQLRAPAATAAPTEGAANADAAAAPAAAAAPPASSRPIWVGLLIACAGVATTAIVLLVAFGYVALAGTISRQMVWTGVVFATAYLLFQLIDDVCEAVLSSKGGFGERLHKSVGIDAKLLDQASVLLSGVLRVALFFYMVIALMAPFGTGPDEVFRRGSTVNHSLKVGEFTLAPQALLTAVAVMIAGLLMIRVIKRWLSDRYFPNTSLEPGMRSSIVTLLGYVGGIVVIAVALAGLGISVERIAWVASALSVGIGFGLQAIVQNFISGLILLAERPVKVGDWVVLGTTEGDVRRVNVRATEIQLGDRSTVIVPNSEFITKTVRNMTLTGAPGRVLLRLPAPLTVDAKRMRDLILAEFTAHEGILDNPEPIVQLEDIISGTLTFLAIGYVSNPRNAGGVKSELLFSILESLRVAGLTLSPPASTTVAPYAPGAALPSPDAAPPLPTVAVPQPEGAVGGPRTAT